MMASKLRIQRTPAPRCQEGFGSIDECATPGVGIRITKTASAPGTSSKAANNAVRFFHCVASEGDRMIGDKYWWSR